MDRDKTLREICKRFESMGQPNSLSVVVLADSMQAEHSWDQDTLDELRQKAQEECAKGPNQMIMGWPSYFRNAVKQPVTT